MSQPWSAMRSYVMGPRRSDNQVRRISTAASGLPRLGAAMLVIGPLKSIKGFLEDGGGRPALNFLRRNLVISLPNELGYIHGRSW